jgi:hypothetical protein
MGWNGLERGKSERADILGTVDMLRRAAGERTG